MTGASSMDEVSAELADLADALLQAALSVAAATHPAGRSAAGPAGGGGDGQMRRPRAQLRQ
ncbi:hypothetical protein [Fodinicola feengrottensis]|uniref:hypothetical protein n=1 Tax=Fodinicola feengrottensis TaxID=435914 RepID=UPI0024432F53|nr:hypothetical protein [Fodinicola feengrottensis]